MRDIAIERLPTFRIRFDLLATYADYVVAVYEQDAGGEATELGKISATPYFEDSHVLPRDYAWMTDRNLETEEDVVAAGVWVAANEDVESDALDDELERLVRAARRNDVEIATEAVRERVEERNDAEHAVVSYSWVHLNEFRLFELHGRCYPWADPDDLRSAVERLP